MKPCASSPSRKTSASQNEQAWLDLVPASPTDRTNLRASCEGTGGSGEVRSRKRRFLDSGVIQARNGRRGSGAIRRSGYSAERTLLRRRVKHRKPLTIRASATLNSFAWQQVNFAREVVEPIDDAREAKISDQVNSIVRRSNLRFRFLPGIVGQSL